MLFLCHDSAKLKQVWLCLRCSIGSSYGALEKGKFCVKKTFKKGIGKPFEATLFPMDL